MNRRIWPIWIGLIILLILLSLAGSSSFAALSFLGGISQNENYQVAGNSGSPVELTVNLIPKAVSPGQSFNLYLEVTNSGEFQVSPEIIVGVPDAISLDMRAIPAGMIFNVQNNTISWRPIIEGQETADGIPLQFTANVATIEEPLQEITSQIMLGDEARTVTASVWIGVLPTANIFFDPPLVAVGQPVQMQAQVHGPGPINQEWFLGDGRVVEAQDPTVIFPAAGTYEVSVKASNPLGVSRSLASIKVIPQPIAHFTPADLTIAVGEDVYFFNESGGQQPLEFNWDFADGYGSQEIAPSHRFNEPGSYLVHLVAKNEFGLSESYTEVAVGAPPIADAIIPIEGTAGQIVDLLGFTDDTVTDISWDMGDGKKVQGLASRHVYWAAGDYLVQMTAKNEFGPVTISQQIHINKGRLFLFIPLVQSLSAVSPDADPVAEEALAPIDSGDLPLAEVETQLVESQALRGQLKPLEFASDTGPADQLLAYINLARSINSLRPLRYVHELSVAAQRHTEDMANSNGTGHVGSDNSSPALRIQESGYPGGYGGEATAWGMDDPIEPVEFWLNSPGHRAILLHPAVSDVGVGFTLNYDAPNIWYWTAEFGSLSLSQIVIQPTPTPEGETPAAETPGDGSDLTIQLFGPPQESSFELNTDNVLFFTWSMKNPLEDGQFISLILGLDGTEGAPIGSANVPTSGSQFQLVVNARKISSGPGKSFWQVKLFDQSGHPLSESVKWPILLIQSDTGEIEPSPTPVPTTFAPPTGTPDVPAQPTPLPLSTPLPSPTP